MFFVRRLDALMATFVQISVAGLCIHLETAPSGLARRMGLTLHP
jgi:hypothetical protein